MELVFLNYKIGEEDINLVVHHNIITGVINDVDNTLYNLLGLKKIGKGQIVINNQKISREDIYMNRKRIAQVPDINIFPSYLKTVEDLMNDHFRLFCLNVKNPLKKIKDSLKIVGLDEEYIYRDLVSLSSSERKLVTIALGLLSNPDTIILEEPFKFLDMKQEKRLYMLLEKLKEQYNKTIIIKTEDAEVIYKYLRKQNNIRYLENINLREDTPLFVPVFLSNQKRNELKRYLIENKVYCPNHWGIPKEINNKRYKKL